MLERGFYSFQQAKKWEEALLCGNGTIGALVMGKPLDETLIVSHEKLLLPLHHAIPPVDTASHLSEIRQMLDEAQYQQAADFVASLAKKEGYGPKRWTDSFFPAVDIRININSADPVSRYRRSIDFSSGIASINYTTGDLNITEEAFVSRADGVIVVRLTADKPGLMNCCLNLSRHMIDETEDYWQGQTKYSKYLGEFSVYSSGDTVFYRNCFERDSNGYECMARAIPSHGAIHSDGQGIQIECADEVLILAAIMPLEDVRYTCKDELARRLNAVDSRFNELLARHTHIHRNIFDRTCLCLGDSEKEDLPAETLLEKSLQGVPDSQFIEKIFDAGRYAILSSSGDWPPNLQGVWAGKYGAEWSSDYTNNGNVQTAIASTLTGNMPECMDSNLRYMEYLVPDSRVNAKRLYDCRGLLLASRTSTHGLNNHFDGTWPMTFWTAGAAWNARFFYDHWLFTGDDQFFLTRALPYMKEVSDFYQDFMILDERGYWRFTPSYSPENHPANTGSQASINATMDIAAARELFNNLVEGCQTLGLEQHNLPHWRNILEKMPPYEINGDGAIKEWCYTGLEDRYDHRHASHLYPLFYSVSKELKKDTALLQAFKKAYEKRLAERRKEADVMAFGYVQLGLAAAHLGDAENLEFIINTLACGYYYANFASAHNRGPEIFNTDLSGGMPALIIEALVQSDTINNADGSIDRYEIKLLPALPTGWGTGEISGVLTRGGFIVDVSWSKCGLNRAKITNRLMGKCTVVYRGCSVEFDAFECIELYSSSFSD